MIRKRGLSKTVTTAISLPEDMLKYIDSVAEDIEVSRSEVVQWVFIGIMNDPEVEKIFFGDEEEETVEEEESGEEEEA